MTDLNALAAKVEGLIWPCRETDALIWVSLPEQHDCEFVAYVDRPLPWRSLGINDVVAPDSWVMGIVFRRNGIPQSFSSSWPHFTASIDAAMTLVPEGWKLRQMHFSGPCADDRKWHLNLHGGKVGEDTFVGRGATQALALTAAALRARAVGRGE